MCRFEGTGASKKLSKAAAARSALATLHNLKFLHTPAYQPSSVQADFCSQLPQPFADHVAKLVYWTLPLVWVIYSIRFGIKTRL